MLTVLVSIFGVIITILLVVGVHEFGHFFVARLVGVKVLRFSIGFGKALYRWYGKSGTEYVFAAIPLGGYVKLLDENEGDVPPNELHQAYNRQPLYKRIPIILAGPLSNVVFAFLLYWTLFMVGVNSIVPIIGKVQPHSIAAQAGIQSQDEIISVDGSSTPNWMSIIIDVLMRVGDKGHLQIQTKNAKTQQIQTHDLDLTTWRVDDLKPDPLLSLGISPFEPSVPAIIGSVESNSPAANAKLQVGDRIISIANKPVKDWLALLRVVSENPGKTLTFTIERVGKKITQPVTIGSQSSWFSEPTGFLGVNVKIDWPTNLVRKNKYDLIAAIPHAWHDTVIFTHMNFFLLGKMITGKISLKSLGGPITIFQSAGTALNEGLVPFLSFLAFLSISIGIINILPIPGLDGGHLLFQFIEFLTRKPVSVRAQTIMYRLGLAFLLVIMIQAIANDIMRL